MKKKQHGGPGRNQGRKPAENPKRQVYTWVTIEAVDKLGGHDNAKQTAEAAIYRAAAKVAKNKVV